MKMFDRFLSELNEGGPNLEASTALETLLREVREKGTGGSMTMTITVKPHGQQWPVDRVLVSCEIKEKLPRSNRPDDIFYLNASGEATRDNPKQQRLNFSNRVTEDGEILPESRDITGPTE